MTLIGKGPQGSGSSGGAAAITSTIFEDESIAVTNVFVTHVTVDLELSHDAVCVLYNSSGTETMDYKIYASADNAGSAPADSDSSWVNILDTNSDPALYDDNELKTLAVGQTFYESLSNKFRWFRVELKAQTTTLTAAVWFRGRSVR